MTESVDVLASGVNAEKHAGSSPAIRRINIVITTN